MQNVHISTSDSAVDETKVVEVQEDTSALFTKEELEDDTSAAANLKGDSAARKKFFATKENRRGRVIPKDVCLNLSLMVHEARALTRREFRWPYKPILAMASSRSKTAYTSNCLLVASRLTS